LLINVPFDAPFLGTSPSMPCLHLYLMPPTIIVLIHTWQTAECENVKGLPKIALRP